jgi:hypothetical protein
VAVGDVLELRGSQSARDRRNHRCDQNQDERKPANQYDIPPISWTKR